MNSRPILKSLCLLVAICIGITGLAGCGDEKPKSDKKDKAEKSKKEKKSKKKSKDEKKDKKPEKEPVPDIPSQNLTVAISPDIPPYVMKKAASGFEVDLVRAALKGHELTFIQMPYKQLQTAVADKKADVAVGVQPETDGGNYSDDFVTFANFAISKRDDGFKIRKVADLIDRKVIAWQDAYSELGPEFEKLFAPSGTDRQNYREIADQREQVETFWRNRGVVIVIDRTVFSYFTKELGYSTAGATSHSIFPAVTNFKVAFADPALRDSFNARLAALCKSGEYKKLLNKYEIVLEETVCDE